jgi:Acetyl-CoA dehydrogenase C-terminal like/Acyl-CoA dehydrogenase, C-terminal domain
VRATNAALLLDLLTPIAKSYPSEMGTLTTSAAVQILGGAGYTTDFPVEQFYREARIHPIHEGTTGIHGLDLLGRKVTMQNGRAVQLLLVEIQTDLTNARQHAELGSMADQLTTALGILDTVTKHLLNLAPTDTEAFLADATLYLELFGIVVLAWQWLRQATVATTATAKLTDTHSDDANFYQGKLMAVRYFYEYELVKIHSLSKRLRSDDRVTIAMKSEWF